MVQIILEDDADISVKLTPGFTNGDITHLVTEVTLGEPRVHMGQVLVQIPLRIATVPTARYDGNVLKAFDLSGPLELAHSDDEHDSPITWRRWYATRPTNGTVRITAFALPRKVDATTKTGPCFDLRCDNGGLITTGYSILPLPPDTDEELELKLGFDNAYAPSDFRGMWTHGTSLSELVTRLRAPSSKLRESVYCMGPISAIESSCAVLGDRDDPKTEFGLYWLSPPPFDVEKVAAMAMEAYRSLCDLLDDHGSHFRIFIRHDPYPVLRSGVALPKCYILSFGSLLDGRPDATELISFLLPHETVHNWLTLSEHDTAAMSLQWYAEGLAEYYSLFVQHPRHLSDTALCRQANMRAQAYYTNPLARYSDKAVCELTWKDQNAQRLPYGRGFVFFVRLNALMKEKTAGKHGLDDLVRDMVAKARGKGTPACFTDFMDRLSHDLGAAAAAKEYEDMSSGERLVVPPPSHSLLPGFTCRRCDQEGFELGFDEDSILEGPRVVKNLRPASRAARAGVRDGDLILEWTNLNDCRDKIEARMHLRLRRVGGGAEGGEEVRLSFWPRTWHKVESYQWFPEGRAHAVASKSAASCY